MKAQTATEYLVILGVVVAISVIAVSILSDTLVFSSSLEENTLTAWSTQAPLQITEIFVSSVDVDLAFRNVGSDLLRLNNFTINGVLCTPEKPIGDGETVYISMNNQSECGRLGYDLYGTEDTYDFGINLTYQIGSTTYTISSNNDDSFRLRGTAVSVPYYTVSMETDALDSNDYVTFNNDFVVCNSCTLTTRVERGGSYYLEVTGESFGFEIWDGWQNTGTATFDESTRIVTASNITSDITLVAGYDNP